MATTKTQAFNNKIKALKDYHTRLVTGVGGIPSSSDIQATLKYFHSTLKGILKETTNICPESYGSRGKDAIRISLFPTFHYGDLYYLVIGLCEFVNKLNNQSGVCEAILKVFHVLIPFLEFDDLDMLPLIVTSCINLFPASQHPAIIELLCSTVIPFVYSWNEDSESYAIGSIPSILQIVFQHIEKSEYHAWVVESLMSKKRHFWKDLMMLIAFGSTESRIPATFLLFFYWPELVPVQFKSNRIRFPAKYNREVWKPILCERTDCPNKASKIEAKKMSFEPHIAANYGNKVPPLYLCLDCFDSLSRNKIENLYDVVLPIKSVKLTCESKTCRSKSNGCYVTCYSYECTSLNSNKPIRFCETCHIQIHLGAHSKKHIFQQQIPEVWDCGIDIQSTVVEAIISLCMEINPRWRRQMTLNELLTSGQEAAGGGGGSSGYTKYNLDTAGTSSMLGVIKSFSAFQDTDITLASKYSEEDQKVISLYAAFLIGEKCPSKPNNNIEILSRIISGLFQWFLDTNSEKDIFVTQEIPTESVSKFFEKIKREYILKWIQQVVENNLEVVLMVLLPYPMEYAKVGTCWDSLCDRNTQVREGLEKIYSLIPYDVITFETWDYIIPFWLETLRTEIQESYLNNFQYLLNQIFHQHSGPFPFLPAKLYNFATQRFSNTSLSVKDQALNWLEILTSTKVVIPMKELLTMFSEGVKTMKLDKYDVEENQSKSKQTKCKEEDNNSLHRGSSINSQSKFRQPSGPTNPEEESMGGSTSGSIDPAQQELLMMMLGCSPDGDNLSSGADLVDLAMQDQSGALSGSNSSQNLDQYSVLSCLVLMMKITSQQLKSNDPNGHGNMSQETPTLTLRLLCDMLQVDWNNSEHQCLLNNNNINNPSNDIGGDADPMADVNPMGIGGYCSSCCDALEWHQLANVILEHICPVNAVPLAEVSMTIESITQHAHTKEPKDVISELNTEEDSKKNQASTPDQENNHDDESLLSVSEMSNPIEYVPLLQEIPEEDVLQPDEDINQPIKEPDQPPNLANNKSAPEIVINKLSVEHKLLYLLIDQLRQFTFDPEITDAVLKSIGYLVCHADLIKIINTTAPLTHQQQHANNTNNANSTNTGTTATSGTTTNQSELTQVENMKNQSVDYILQNSLVELLWELLCSEFSFLSAPIVKLLLHCFTVKSGADKFWSILDKEFSSDDWTVRFDAVERVTILARNIDQSMIVENHAIISSLAHSFSNLIGSLDDVNVAVVTKTNFYLETIKEKSLACIVKCLEFQFDSVIADRTLILLRMYQLSWALPGRMVFSWDFFINRFGIFSIEAQLGNNFNMDISNVTDLNNQKCTTDLFRQQFERARIAVSRCQSIRSINSSGSSISPPKAGLFIRRTISEQAPSSRINPNITPLINIAPQHTTQASTNRLSQAPKHPPANNDNEGGLNVAEYTDPNNRFLTNIQEALDLEGSSRDTLHQWVTLLLKFMANVDMQASKDELKEKKALSKVQRHLALLLGYTEQSFNIPPYKLRNSTVFHAFLSNIAQVMDRNFSLGNSILHQTLVVLQYCASPQRYASDSQPATFSLWLLEPQTRIHWLNTLLVILYKYEYNASGAGSGVMGGFRSIVDYLVRITINTVQNHLHVCKISSDDEGHSPVTPHIPRPRDTSNVSVDVDTAAAAMAIINSCDDSSPPSPSSAFAIGGPFSDGSLTGGGISGRSRCSNNNLLLQQHYYAKKDKEIETLTSRFTSPVIKKKVARQYRGRSGAPSNQQSSNVSSNNNNNSNVGYGSVGANASLAIDQSINADTIDSDSARVISNTSCYSDSVVVKEIILAPITVSTDERFIQPANQNLQPLLEEGFIQENKDAVEKDDIYDRSIENKSPSPTNLTKENTIIEEKETAEEEGEEDSSESEDEMELYEEEEDQEEGEASSGNRITPDYRVRKSRKFEMLTCDEVGNNAKKSQHVESSVIRPGRRRPRRHEMEVLGAASSSGQSMGMNSASLGGLVGHKSGGSANAGVETFMVERCKHCQSVLEHYDDATLGLAIVCFGAYVHREPALAAPCLLDMLLVAAKIASHNMYSWRINLPNIVVPGNLISIARQFLRCSFYNLYPNGLFVQLFQTEIENADSFFKCIVSVLLDFEDHLNLFQPILQVLEGLNKKKAIASYNVPIVIENLADYLEALPTNLEDSKDNHQLASWWLNAAPQFDQFLHKLQSLIPPDTDITPVLRIMIVMIRANTITGCKSLIDTFAGLIRFIVENCNFTLPPILELCSMTNRLYKEKGKSLLTKCLIEELHAAIKFKIYIPDRNLLMLIQFVLMDAGGTIEPNKICEGLTELFNPATYHILNTGSAELMRQHLVDCIAFLSDVHTVHKVKQNQKLTGSQSLHEDTLGSHLKSSIGQFVALELSSGVSSRINYANSSGILDNRDSAILHFMPWLKSIPPSAQQGPREFILCVERVRTLNWLLLGSMIHTSVTGNSTGITCQPIPLAFNKSVADLVKVILSGFPDQQKQSVIVMSSLYHAFVLCQLWTMYCETAASLHSIVSQSHQDALKTALEFWMTILPTILHLLTISDDFVVVNGHLLTIMEELIECRSMTVAKVIHWWTPILMGRNKQLPGNLHKRLQKCIECEPPQAETLSAKSELMIRWLKKHVFVLGRNEDQHSAATHIFVQ